MPHLARRADGQSIPPGSGVVPVLHEICHMQLKVVGTAFYVTRYGLFVTAGHVLQEIADWSVNRLKPAYILEDSGLGQLIIRRIVGISLSNLADLAIGQAENGSDKSPATTGPGNLRGRISLESPKTDEKLVTYAYPENEVLDFRDAASTPTLRGDYFEGKFQAHVQSGTHPFIPQPHFQTSLEIRSGASGCPVFNSQGQIVAIASRGWDFRGSEHEGQNLSSVLPASLLLPIEVGCARIPPTSWEFSQIPPSRRSSVLTFGELVAYGHVDVGTFG